MIRKTPVSQSRVMYKTVYSKPEYLIGHIFRKGEVVEGRVMMVDRILTAATRVKRAKDSSGGNAWRLRLELHGDPREDLVIEPICDEEQNLWDYGSTWQKLKQCQINKDDHFDRQHHCDNTVEKLLSEKWYWFYDGMIKLLKLQLALEESE